MRIGAVGKKRTDFQMRSGYMRSHIGNDVDGGQYTGLFGGGKISPKATNQNQKGVNPVHG
jgi:hypothetical protein